MSEIHRTAPVKARRSGCRWLVLIVASFFGLAVAGIIFCAVYPDFFVKAKKIRRQDELFQKDLRVAVLSYKEQYKHFPIPGDSLTHSDLFLRSRGPMLAALLGEEAGGLNPKKTQFAEFPIAGNNKFGLVKEGEEWVFNDTWGEPFFIVLDTNGDGKIANPEYGASQSSSHSPRFPELAEFPVEVLIYSAGKDRDPKTWQDNVCSWRSH